MPEARLGWRGLACLALLCGLALGPGLGTATRLTYHEAFVAQGAREIALSGNWWHPAIGGLPWLEKPPLPFWLAAAVGRLAGGVSPLAARLPSALAATGLVLGVATLAARRYGGAIGLLSGAIQATTAWTVLRGRLAEADVLLACLVAWTLVAFDRLRAPASARDEPGGWKAWRWAFFGLLGLGALVKGTGFGAALVLSVVLAVLIWERDRATLRRLRFPAGWILVAVLALAWPLAMVVLHGPKVVGLWTLHVAQRFSAQRVHGPFAGESWLEYVPNVLAQALPWTPLAALGVWASLGRLFRARGLMAGPIPPDVASLRAGDRLLWAWSIVPLALVSLASARNAHYAIYALVPWSVWAALGLARLGPRLLSRGWALARLRRGALVGFSTLGLAYGLAFLLLGPRLDRRGVEWAFYESAGRRLPPCEPLVLLYDDWDRDPYPTPFGPIPHDLAVRLYYLDRPACWHFQDAGPDGGDVPHHGRACLWGAAGTPFALIGRERDLPLLEQLGPVEILAQGPPVRFDRTYLLARVHPDAESSARTALRSELTPAAHR
jgi:4-amino-4-deoxy-L-arabinose transferase-like glycosyltransferase